MFASIRAENHLSPSHMVSIRAAGLAVDPERKKGWDGGREGSCPSAGPQTCDLSLNMPLSKNELRRSHSPETVFFFSFKIL